MSSVALAIQNLASRTTSTVEQAEQIRQRSMRSHLVSAGMRFLPMVRSLHKLRSDLDRVTGMLCNGGLDSLSIQELESVACNVSQLQDRLNRLLAIFRTVRLERTWIYGRTISSLESRNEHLASIGEGIYMSLDPGFQEVITNAVDELKALERERSAHIAEVHH